MASVLRMGHAVKTDPETEQLRSSEGYSPDDIPVLESFGLFENGKVNEDFQLQPTEYHAFLTWLSKGPVKPIPDIGIKVLCYYKQKLRAGLGSFSSTDGMRLQQENLISSIDEMLKNGDDTQIPSAICAKGGSTSGSTPTADGCCDEIKSDIGTIKAFITGIKAGVDTSGVSGSGSGGQCNLDAETKQQIVDIKTGVTGLEGAIGSVAALAATTEDKVNDLTASLVDAKQKIEAILAKQGSASSTNNQNNQNLQADYDDAATKATEAMGQAERATQHLQAILGNQNATNAQIQAAIDDAIKTKIEVAKNIAIAQYIFNLDASSASAGVPVPQPVIGGSYKGGKRTQKKPENTAALNSASTKMSELNAAISEAMSRLRTSDTDPTSPGPSVDHDSSGSSPDNKNARISQLTHNLEVRGEEVKALKGTLSLFSKAMQVFVTESGKTIRLLIQKLSAVPNSDFVVPHLDNLNVKITNLGKNTYTKAEFDKMKAALIAEISDLTKLVAKLKEDYAESQKIVETLQESLRKKNARIEHLQRRIQRRDNTIRNLRTEIDSINAELEQVRRQLEECLNRPIPLPDPDVERLRLLVAEQGAEIERLVQNLRIKTEAYDTLHAEKEAAEKDLASLRAEIASTKDDLKEKERQGLNLALRKKLIEQDYKREIEHLKEINEKNKTRLESIEKECERLKGEAERLRNLFRSTSLEELSGKLQEALEELGGEKAKLVNIQQQLAQYEQKQRMNQAVLEEEQRARLVLQAQLFELKPWYDESRAEVERLLKQIAEKDEIINTLLQSMGAGNKEEFAKQLEDLRAQIASRDETIKGIEGQIREEKSKNAALELELAKTKSLLQSKEAEIADLKAKAGEHQIAMKSAVAEINSLKQKLATVTQVLSLVVENFQGIGEQSALTAKLRKQVYDLQMEKASLQRQIENLEKSVAEKSTLLDKSEVERTRMAEQISGRNRNISGLQVELASAKASEASYKTALEAAKAEFVAMQISKQEEYDKLVASDMKKGAELESLQAQLAAALAQKASAEATLNACKEAARLNMLAKDGNIALIETLKEKIAVLESEKSAYAANISGRDQKMHNESEAAIKRLQEENARLLSENDNLTKMEGVIRADLDKSRIQLAEISVLLASKKSAEATHLEKIREAEERIRLMQETHQREVAKVHEQYQAKAAEFQRLVAENSRLESEIARLQGELQNGKGGTASELLRQIEDLKAQKASIEAQYQEEFRKHEETRRAMEAKAAKCAQMESEIAQRMGVFQRELEMAKQMVSQREHEISLLRQSKSRQDGEVAKQIGSKDREIQELQGKILLLSSQLGTAEGAAQLGKSYLREIEVLRQTINELRNAQTNPRNSPAQRYLSQGQSTMPSTSGFGQPNFPGSSQTQRKNERRNGFKTLKLGNGPNPLSPAEQYISQTPGLTERNFPGLVKIRNAAQSRNRINRERQEWQKTNPQRNLYGGTRKKGRHVDSKSTLTILPSVHKRKGARMAKSKRNIHPLK